MLLDHGTLEDYLADVAELLERYGVVLDLAVGTSLVLEETPSHSLAFEAPRLSAGRAPAAALRAGSP